MTFDPTSRSPAWISSCRTSDTPRWIASAGLCGVFPFIVTVPSSGRYAPAAIFTGGDLEVDPLKRLDPAEGFPDRLQLEHYFCSSLSLVQKAVRFSFVIVSMP